MIRQEGKTIDSIREDHRRRYMKAAELIDMFAEKGPILDIGCGVGYGSYLLAELTGQCVTGFDRSQDAIQHALTHYYNPPNGTVSFQSSDLKSFQFEGDYEAATMFEIIEHTDEAPAFLIRLAYKVPVLFGSVPNEDVVPYKPGKSNPEHYRHYTHNELLYLLQETGWKPTFIGCQFSKTGPASTVDLMRNYGRTLFFMATSTRIS